MHYVYRVQNAKGCGPYTNVAPTLSGFRRVWQDGVHTKKTGRPCPLEENPKIARHIGRGLFGFASLNQLQAWFSPTELRRLDALGYRPTRVKASEIVFRSSKQLMFLPA